MRQTRNNGLNLIRNVGSMLYLYSPNLILSMKKLLFALLGLLISIPLLSQDFEGIIVYKITYTDLPAEMKGKESVMPDTQTFYLKKTKSKFEMATPRGNTTIFSDSENHTSTVLMKTMGQNFKMTFTSEELDKIDSLNTGKYIVTYQKENKTIAGYVCKKATVASKDNKKRVTLFYTDKIQPMNIKGLEGLNIKGMPLEYIIKTEDMSMNVTVEKVEQKKVDDAIFTIPDGYKEMPESMKTLLNQ